MPSSRRALARLLGATAPLALTAALVAGCSDDDGGSASQGEDGSGGVGVITTAAPDPASPAEPAPAASEADRQPVPGDAGECPYLSADEASEAVGEKLGESRLDASFDPPACFYYTEDGRLSLLVAVQDAGSPQHAVELVDGLVPPESTERSDVEGWTGGRSGAQMGASLALYKDARVLTVQSTQAPSEAVQAVAELVVPRVG